MKLASLVRVRWLVGVLLIAGAALFAVDASAERDIDQQHEANNTEVGSEPANENVLGINLESTLLVVVAVIISLVLAAATWRSNTKLIVLITAAFAAVFAALDIAELVHQIDRPHPDWPCSPPSSLSFMPAPRSWPPNAAPRAPHWPRDGQRGVGATDAV